MNIIKTVSISGIWGAKNFFLPANTDVNFLIGVNGTGKTTAINLIAAALNADFSTLDKIMFEKIVIELNEFNGNKKPSIEIYKKRRKGLPFRDIQYFIRNRASENPKVYSLDTYEAHRYYRESVVYSYREKLHRSTASVSEHLKQLVNVSWLSIHRAEPVRAQQEDRSYESTVDRKLNQLSVDIGKYFSSMDKKDAAEIGKFQEMVFMSLVAGPSDSTYFLQPSQRLDIDEEKKTLIQIFRQFKLSDNTFMDDVEKHFERVVKANNNLQKKANINSEELIALVYNSRIDNLAAEWKELLTKHQLIYEPKETFLKIANKLLYKKKLLVNDKNEFVAETESGNILSLTQLSSGEKQLIILLGEGLLQDKEPWVYIADEPELSLHVLWQSQLIDSLREINPNAQIIFATHSPDILGRYGNKQFEMEEVLK